MTLNNAIQQLDLGKAAKRPSMMGYIYLKDLNPETVVESDENGEAVDPVKVTALAIVERDGNETVFTDDADAKCVLDKTLFECLVADDWEIANRDDYEKARSGHDRW